MKKELQLRGISRTPSDRMTSDGGCAESLNVQMDQEEIAPILAPDNVTKQYIVTGSFPGKVLYLHKGRDYNNVIYIDEANNLVKAKEKVVSEDTPEYQVFALREDEEIKAVTNVGNVLVFTTNLRMEYVLYKDKEYRDLGDHVPVPAVEFTSQPVEDTSEFDGGVAVLWPEEGGSMDNMRLFDPNTWDDYLNGQQVSGDEKQNKLNASYALVKEQLWNTVNKQIKVVKRKGYMCAPVFARYALRLYDGSYIYQSVPILLGAGKPSYLTAYGLATGILLAKLENIYEGKARLIRFDKEGWEDVIDSIDIFLSTDIYTPKLYSDVASITDNGNNTITLNMDVNDDDALVREHIKEEVLSKRTFYRVASFTIDDLSKLEEGYNLMSDKNFVSQDYLVTQLTLPDEYRSFHRKIAGNLFKYNERMMMTGIDQEITSGYECLNGLVVTSASGGGDDPEVEPVEDDNPDEPIEDESDADEEDGDDTTATSPTYEFRFYVRDADKDMVVMGRNVEGGFQYQYTDGEGHSFAWIAYPDTRCYRVDVRVTAGEDVTIRRYTMEAHPGLNCAYAFIGLENEIGLAEDEEIEDWSEEENRIYTEKNVVWASEMRNPFLFPVTGRISFYDEVIAVANATRALSEGQFGQYPLYVFTKGGIWSVPISATGDFTASVPMSRDVALSADSIQPIEQAIVFVSAQGVMLLQGSNVTSLSTYMMGKHHKSTSDVLALLAKSDKLRPYAPAYNDDLPFGEYVSACKIAYDYTNSRLIFYRDDQDYQYVYRFGSQSWHKMSMAGLGMRIESGINSYPDCLLSVRMATAVNCKLYDFSVEYDTSVKQDTLPGLIITRPFDLEAVDVRKVITDIRVRGNYNRNDVKYILVGSMDGHNWGVLPSLRGGSYKLFRLVLLMDLESTERISWVDVTYEPRLANKLR